LQNGSWPHRQKKQDRHCSAHVCCLICRRWHPVRKWINSIKMSNILDLSLSWIAEKVASFAIELLCHERSLQCRWRFSLGETPYTSILQRQFVVWVSMWPRFRSDGHET
jgi:hypothetical protein